MTTGCEDLAAPLRNIEQVLRDNNATYHADFVRSLLDDPASMPESLTTGESALRMWGTSGAVWSIDLRTQDQSRPLPARLVDVSTLTRELVTLLDALHARDLSHPRFDEVGKRLRRNLRETVY